MANYDFRSLSPPDFERLVRDLLQAEFKVPLESFKAGRDKGIDLRYSRAPASSFIVQCKHYVDSRYATLYSELKRNELPKVRALAPTRYILATSVGLTQGNKEALQSLFSPFIKTPQDILGADDINGLLARFPEIERHHIKLFLTSTAVLEQILHNGMFVRAASLRNDIEHKVQLYVPNDSFWNAHRILEEYHACVISGIPGIGKTTLAEMLLWYYASHGYSVYSISSDVKEADEVYGLQDKQIFYYDDFLGQSGAEEKLGKNEDDRIMKLMRRVAREEHPRFIMTTRGYLLEQARMYYEKMARYPFEPRKCIVDLGSYTRMDRAMILYNHLYFSKLPREWTQALLNGEHLSIIDHPHYSPRLVETVIDRAKERAPNPTEFVAFVKRVFDDPQELWIHPFEHQLSSADRRVLLTLVTLPAWAHVEDLRSACSGTPGVLLGKPLGQGGFRDALKMLDDSFVRIEPTAAGSLVALHNPSIRDFLISYLDANPEYVGELIESASFFAQCQWLWGQRLMGRASRLREEIAKKLGLLVQAMQRTFESPECEFSQFASSPGAARRPWASRKTRELEERLQIVLTAVEEGGSGDQGRWLAQATSSLCAKWEAREGSKWQAVRLLQRMKTSRFWTPDEVELCATTIKEWCLSTLSSSYDFDISLDMYNSFVHVFSEEDVERFRSEFDAWWEGQLNHVVDEETDAGDAEDIVNTVTTLGGALEVEIDWRLLNDAESRVDELKEEEQQAPDHGVRNDEFSPEDALLDASDEEVRSLFDGLDDD